MDIFSNIKLIMAAIGGTIVLGLVLALLWTHADLSKAKETIMAKSFAIEQQVKTIFGMQKDVKAITDANNDVNQLLNDATDAMSDMNDRLSKMEHAAAEDAQVMANKEMADHIRCLVLASGAKLDKDEVNVVCPQITKRIK